MKPGQDWAVDNLQHCISINIYCL